jgi:hypothetical protein
MVEEIGDDGQAVTTGTGDKPAPSPAKPGSEAPQVTARSTKPELVDYAVAQGQDRAEAEKLTVKELQERYVRQQ